MQQSVSRKQFLSYKNQGEINCPVRFVSTPLQSIGGPFGYNLTNRSDSQPPVTRVSLGIDIRKNTAEEFFTVPAHYCYVEIFPQSYTFYFLRTNGAVANVEDIFDKLYTQWREQTKFYSFISNSTDIYHEKIVQLGYSAVPFIINKLRKEHAHLFIALSRITGENPVKKENMGKVNKMVEDWIQWWEGRIHDMG